MKIVAVTSCPSGIAHTYMAAEALEEAAKRAGIEIVVETQGSAGSTPIDPAFVADADAAIFAHELPINDKTRFDGLPIVDVPVDDAITKSDQLITQAIAKAEKQQESGSKRTGNAPATTTDGDSHKASAGTSIMNQVMTGVSYMIPFVAAGGILIALGFMLGGYDVSDHYNVTGENGIPTIWSSFQLNDIVWWGALLYWTGQAAFQFLVPVLAGYIAFAIADRPGIAPGFVGGYIATQVGAGFLGGIVAGFLAGYAAYWIARIPLPKALNALKPVIIIPLFASLITGILLFTVVGAPVSWLMGVLNDALASMSGANLAILCLVLGLMMGFDLGGPVNKVAYLFATTGLASADLSDPNSTQMIVMAAVMAAGMTPPLGIALATVLRKDKFTPEERDNGKAAWVLGISFISEGAIPFAASDPLRIIPSTAIGSAVTGMLVALWGATSPAPHGGIWVIALIGNWYWFILAVIIGTVVTGFLVLIAKSIGGVKATQTPTVQAVVEEQPA